MKRSSKTEYKGVHLYRADRDFHKAPKYYGTFTHNGRQYKTKPYDTPLEASKRLDLLLLKEGLPQKNGTFKQI